MIYLISFQVCLQGISTSLYGLFKSMDSLQTLLFLGANHTDTKQEIKGIKAGLERGEKRNQFEFKDFSVAKSQDIYRAILDVDPQIVHFSGYGEDEGGLVFKDDYDENSVVTGKALINLFELFADKLHCVVLNGCYSEMQAKAIAWHIPYVIGLEKANSNQARICFSVAFYDALVAGRDVEFAFKLGKVAIEMEITCQEDYRLPVLHRKTDNNQAERLNELLRTLNYQHQMDKMITEINEAGVAKVILIQVTGFFAQRWLLKRLVLIVPNYNQSWAFSIDANKSWNKGLQYFWELLARELKADPSPGSILQKICEKCRTQPVIIAIQGIQKIHANTLEKLLFEFWHPLLQKLSEQPFSTGQNKCVLFFTTDLDVHPTIENLDLFKSNQETVQQGDLDFEPASYGIDLAPWDIVTVQDLNEWLNDDIKELITACFNEITCFLPIGKMDGDRVGSPEEVLQKICESVNLNAHDDSLKKCWDISL
jgi:inactive STAND